jgi:hypothetical protein
MSTFDEREQAFERKFQQDQELAFKAKARRNKLVGLWAAEQLGLSGTAAEAYARDVVAAELAQPSGGEHLVAKLAGDFARKGIAIDATRIHLELDRCGVEAKRQLGIKE